MSSRGMWSLPAWVAIYSALVFQNWGVLAAMDNCSFGVNQSEIVCRSSANIAASCLTEEYYQVLKPRFCHAIRYPIWIGKGGASLEDVQQIDQQARMMFNTGIVNFNLGLMGAVSKCCRETYRAFVCIEMFPRCRVDDTGLVERFPTCRSWKCNSFQARTDVEKRIPGYKGKPCFSDDSAGAECGTNELMPLHSMWEQKECTCPIHNVTTGKGCVPFHYKVAWEDTADMGNIVPICDDISGIVSVSSASPTWRIPLFTAAASLFSTVLSMVCSQYVI